MRRRVLLVQPSLQPPGGGNGVAAWTLQALQDHHDLGVLTWTPVDLDPVNRYYGTALRRSALDATLAAPRLRPWLDLLPFPLDLLKRALLFRAARRVASDWDVLLSIHNEADFGRRGIQYVHYPAYRMARPQDDVRWYHGPRIVREAYYHLAEHLASVDLDRIRRNLTLVNSDWTGSVFQRWHGTSRPLTVYPPVPDSFPDVAWEDRHEGFLCVGRVSPEKELERVFDILSRVRQRRPGITLRLVGSLGRDAYSRGILRRIAKESSWIALDQNLSRAQLVNLLPRYRYGIHGMREEHFGMAPAEMVAAGCIVFVPAGGGQVEVVGGEQALTYTDVQDAADKIEHVLAHPEVQRSLRQRLSQRRALFSTERFMASMREIVETFPPS